MRLSTEFVKPHPSTGQALIRPRAVHTPQSKSGSSRAFSRPDTWRAQCQPGPAVLEPMQESSATAQYTAVDESIIRQDSGLHCSTSERGVGTSEDLLRSISEVLQRAGGAKYYQEAGFLSNAVERRGLFQEVDEAASAEAEEEEAGSEATTRGRQRRVGRPAGLTSWNKGISMSEATKQKISSAQKQRWRDPALRASVSEKQKGRVPWNKGKTVSKETREKMSRARRFTVYPDALCAKLGRSHRGLTHSPETCALLSKKLSGKAKSPEHRAAIAAGQRKRFAASRLLNAARAFAPQEECDTEVQSSSSAQEAPCILDTEVLYSSGSPAKRKAVGTAKLPDNSAVVEDFVGQLRRFRALQEELEPWTSAFRAEHGRKPRIEDVQLTTNAWLVSKFKDYMLLRGRLLNESQLLRNKIEGPGPRNGKNILGGTLYREKLNANEPATGSVSEGAARIASALKYRRSQTAGHPAPSSSPAAVAAPDQQQQSPPETQQINGHSEESAEANDGAAVSITETELPISGDISGGASPARSSATAAHSSMNGCGGNGAMDPSHDIARKDAAIDPASNGTASAAPAEPEKGVRVVSPSLLPGASPRVRSAMLAAMDYRKKQARKSKPEV